MINQSSYQKEVAMQQGEQKFEMQKEQQKHGNDMQMERFKANQEFKRLVFEKAAEEEFLEMEARLERAKPKSNE